MAQLIEIVPMDRTLRETLIETARNRQPGSDPSHDFEHILRVLHLAEKLAESTEADLDILVAAALFHDIVVRPKNTMQSRSDTEDSALVAKAILRGIDTFPCQKTPHVMACIRECSFSRGLKATSIESEILQDADRLEATGAIAIMRTFSSGGQMRRPLYPAEDPMCRQGSIRFRSSLDLFFERLLVVGDAMNTARGKALAKRRTRFLKQFLEQLQDELSDAGMI